MDRYIYVNEANPLPHDAISIFRAANILDVMPSVFSNNLRRGHYPSIDVYKLSKGNTGKQVNIFLSLAQINELIIPPRIRKTLIVNDELCLNMPATSVYLAYRECQLKRVIYKESILNAGIRKHSVCNQKRKFVFLTLKSLNAFMKDNVMAWGYKSLYYHRILNDDHPIYPDDPMYNRGNGDMW